MSGIINNLISINDEMPRFMKAIIDTYGYGQEIKASEASYLISPEYVKWFTQLASQKNVYAVNYTESATLELLDALHHEGYLKSKRKEVKNEWGDEEWFYTISDKPSTTTIVLKYVETKKTIKRDPKQFIDVLIEQSSKSLFKKDYQAIGRAMTALIEIGSNAVEPVIGSLGNINNIELQLNTIHILEKIGDKQSEEYLQKKTQNPNKYDPVAKAARDALKRLERK
jgi:hypothetical protein